MVIPDEFGHCIVCHKNMLVEEVIDGKVQKRFTPEYTEAQFLLNDKSKMRVAICQPCKNSLKEEHYNEVMQCVIAGWQKQVDVLPWSKEKKQSHMDKYSKLRIVTNSENVQPDVLEHKFNQYKKEVENGNSK